jgi:hypothetical protein
MYVSNALQYIKVGQISYLDHPGTPAIRLLAASFMPLRVLLKFHQRPFIAWTVKHYDIIFFFSRIVEIITFIAGLGLIVWRLARRSIFSGMIFWLTLLSASFIPFIAVAVSPEATSFLLIAIWLVVFDVFLDTGFPFLPTLLALVAGLAVGNKLTNLVLIFSSLSLIPFLKITPRQKVLNFLSSLGFIFIGFAIATWPIHNRYTVLFGWIGRLFTSSAVHGGGRAGVFIFDVYKQSALSLVSQDHLLVLLLALMVFGSTISIASKKFDPSSTIVLLAAVAMVAIFAKYPLSHYQLANITVILFLLSRLTRFWPRTVLVVFCLVAMQFAYQTTLAHLTYLGTETEKVSRLTKFVQSHPSSGNVIWEWARHKDFALIWSRGWGGQFNQSELAMARPNLLELTTPNQVRQISGDTTSLYSICWNQMYIQKAALPIVQPNLIPNSYRIENINSDMVLVSSNYCSSKP